MTMILTLLRVLTVAASAVCRLLGLIVRLTIGAAAVACSSKDWWLLTERDDADLDQAQEVGATLVPLVQVRQIDLAVVVHVPRHLDLHLRCRADVTHGCVQGMRVQNPNADRDVVVTATIRNGDGTLRSKEDNGGSLSRGDHHSSRFTNAAKQVTMTHLKADEVLLRAVIEGELLQPRMKGAIVVDGVHDVPLAPHLVLVRAIGQVALQESLRVHRRRLAQG